MKKLKFTILFIALLLLANSVFGITDSEIELCLSNKKLDAYCKENSEEACQEVLNKCLDNYLPKLQEKYDQNIERTEEERQNLADQVERLENKMNQLDQQIRQSEMRIRNLGFEIDDTQESIQKMNNEIDQSKDQLAEMIKTINREDKKTVLEILVTENDLSGFFNNLTSLETLTDESESILEEIESLRNSLETKEQKLARQREEVEEEVQAQAVQKKQSSQLQSQYEHNLSLTQQELQEKKQQKQLIDEQVQEIMSKQLSLFGISDEEAPSLQKAIDIVKGVEQKTGVRAGFVLSIIMQESKLGRNVGQCYLTDKESGNSKNTATGQLYKRGLKPSRDLKPFLEITSRFGKDPLETPISCYIPMCYSLSTGHVTTNVSMNNNGHPNCPAGYSAFGFGGAIGPAQFLPSRWEKTRSKVKNNYDLGREPNPWDIRDSFLTSGVYLADLGATRDELSAAASYYGTSGLSYESEVMQRTRCLETYIDSGQMTTGCESYITPFLD